MPTEGTGGVDEPQERFVPGDQEPEVKAGQEAAPHEQGGDDMNEEFDSSADRNAVGCDGVLPDVGDHMTDQASECGACPSVGAVGSGCGTATSSQCASPALRAAAMPNLNGKVLADVEHWDWRVDVPEFVPGGLGFTNGAAAPPQPNESPSEGCSNCAGCTQAPTMWTMAAPVAAGMPWGALVPVSSNGNVGQAAAPMVAPVVAPAMGIAAPMPGGDTQPNGEAEGLQPVQQLHAHYEWQVRLKEEELRNMQQYMGRLEAQRAEVKERWERERQALLKEISRYVAVLNRYSIPLEEACEDIMPISSKQHQQQNWESQNCDYANNFSVAWESADFTENGSMPNLNGMSNVNGANGVNGVRNGMNNIVNGNVTTVNGNVNGALNGAEPSSLDAKMRKLNGLLAEEADNFALDGNDFNTSTPPTRTRETPVSTAKRNKEPNHLVQGKENTTPKGKDDDNQGDSGSIASTLQAMFPHATVRTKMTAAGEEKPLDVEVSAGDLEPNGQLMEKENVTRDEVNKLAEELEELTKSVIDERASKALQGLTSAEAWEALLKVDQLVKAQGGRCRNLSSILQSLCRRIERRSAAARNKEEAHAANAGDVFSERVSYGASSRRAEGDDASDANQAINGDDNGAKKRRTRKQRNGADGNEDGSGDTSDGTNSEAESRENRAKTNGNGSFEEVKSDPSRKTGVRDYWTVRRIERVAQRNFILKQSGERLELHLAMGSLDPPLSEVGMDRYCRWLRCKLHETREEFGPQALRRCCGDIDFSNNNLGNQAIWILLDTLAQFEVHAAILKFHKNCISQAGVLAICEFIRANKRSQAIYEIHLSQNDIDDESAHELLRTLHKQRPRYPPRRFVPKEGAEENARGGRVEGTLTLLPIWVRLNDNPVKDSSAVLRKLKAAGISICPAANPKECGPKKCCRAIVNDCPFVHLHLTSQESGQDLA
mmetsp:Transcript_10863/g.24653  ORF Transcript_10863/g.24653 Transcript_10863/m.24653 type:complete len:944 (-) Transcript_10863:173-3004(-)